jgi:hypothetical protein
LSGAATILTENALRFKVVVRSNPRHLISQSHRTITLYSLRISFMKYTISDA